MVSGSVGGGGATTGFPTWAGWYTVSGMETILAAMTGFLGVMLSALLVWIHSDIKALRTEMDSQFQA